MLKEQRENRRERFLIAFNQSVKYQQLRDRLKQVIFRLAVEKYKKSIGASGINKDQRDKFKANLYIYL